MSKLADFSRRMDGKMKSRDIFWRNEIQTNRMVSRIMVYSALILGLCLVLYMWGIFPVNIDVLATVAFWGILELLIPPAIAWHLDYDRWWIKIMLLLAMIFAYARIDSMLTYKVPTLMVVPLLVSSRYFNRTITIIVAMASIVVFAFSAIYGALYGLLDCNIVSLPIGTTIVTWDQFIGTGLRTILNLDNGMLIRNTLLYSYLPKLLIYFLIATISVNISRKGRELVLEQEVTIRRTTRMESELSVARSIQAEMLPKQFPPFPEHYEFDIYAIMQPAKEVAGDFYDFFMLDDSHLAVVMADVSGKGVPAALFMTTARTLIKNHAMSGLDPAEVLNIVNKLLYESSDSGYFVTCWIGYLDCRTGEVIYSNAGHTPPVILQNGEWEIFRCAPGFILGGLEEMNFKSDTLCLKPGDAIYLYTDGVSEAEDINHQLYGEERLLEVLRANKEDNMTDLCKKVKDSVEEHASETEQFDDITMLSVRYLGNSQAENEFTVEAVLDNLDEFTDFVNEKLDQASCPPRNRAQIDMMIDELFSNVTKFAYEDKGGSGPITVRVEIKDDPRRAELTITDNGVPFDPVSYINPEIDKPAIERRIGGLGLFMVRKTADEMIYNYVNGQNVLKLTKNFDL